MIRILISIIIYSLSFIVIAQNKTNVSSDNASTHLYQVEIEINNMPIKSPFLDSSLIISG